MNKLLRIVVNVAYHRKIRWGYIVTLTNGMKIQIIEPAVKRKEYVVNKPIAGEEGTLSFFIPPKGALWACGNFRTFDSGIKILISIINFEKVFAGLMRELHPQPEPTIEVDFSLNDPVKGRKFKWALIGANRTGKPITPLTLQ